MQKKIVTVASEGQYKQPSRVWDEEFAERVTELARQSLSPRFSATQLAVWWKQHYLATGHKRLARLLLELAPSE